MVVVFDPLLYSHFLDLREFPGVIALVTVTLRHLAIT